MIDCASIRTLSAGRDLVRERDGPGPLYWLIEGWACRRLTTAGGARHISAIILPGEPCNLLSLAAEEAPHAVHTLTRATVAVIPRQAALDEADRSPAIARLFLRLACREAAILERWALCLARRSAHARLAHLLCEFAHRLGKDPAAANGQYDLPMTQEQLGDTLGLTSVHINRMMQRLRGASLIATSGRTILIPDNLALRAHAGFDAGYLRMPREAG